MSRRPGPPRGRREGVADPEVLLGDALVRLCRDAAELWARDDDRGARAIVEAAWRLAEPAIFIDNQAPLTADAELAQHEALLRALRRMHQWEDSPDA